MSGDLPSARPMKHVAQIGFLKIELLSRSTLITGTSARGDDRDLFFPSTPLGPCDPYATVFPTRTIWSIHAFAKEERARLISSPSLWVPSIFVSELLNGWVTEPARSPESI